jgi:hypothetical protein
MRFILARSFRFRLFSRYSFSPKLKSVGGESGGESGGSARRFIIYSLEHQRKKTDSPRTHAPPFKPQQTTAPRRV